MPNSDTSSIKTIRRSYPLLLLAALSSLLSTPAMGKFDGALCPSILLGQNEDRNIRQGESLEVDGLVMVQQFGGNFQIYTGALGKLDCLLWETGVCEPFDPDIEYYTRLQQNGKITTRSRTTTDRRDDVGSVVAWQNTDVSSGAKDNYYMIVHCDATINIYDGSFDNVIWSDQGNPRCALAPSSPPPPSLMECRRTILLGENQMVHSNQPAIVGQGGRAHIVQTELGSLEVYAGVPENPQELLWKSCGGSRSDDGSGGSGGGSTSYFSVVQGDSQFITRRTDAPREFVWKRGDQPMAVPQEASGWEWELVLECDNNENASGFFDRLVITDSDGNIAWSSDLLGEEGAGSACE